jgi:hypothetical protein
MDSQTERLVRESLVGVLAGDDPDKGLAEMGWAELVDESPEATALLFLEQGRACRSTAAAGDLIVEVLRDHEIAVPTDAVVAFPRQGAGGPLALRQPGAEGVVTYLDGRLVSARRVGAEPLEALDQDLVLWEVVLGEVETIAEGAPALQAWQHAWNAAAVGVAAELRGLAEVMLETAVTHVTDRMQYGRALGSFQSVRHSLADVLVGVRSAARVEEAAAEAVGGPDETVAAEAAWCLAVGTHAAAATAAMQVCGGMGLTWEHPLHRYVRRGFALEALLGSRQQAMARVGAALLDRPAVPRFPCL